MKTPISPSRLYKYLRPCTYEYINISDPVEKAISKYKYHSSIILIKNKIVNQDKSLFILFIYFNIL